MWGYSFWLLHGIAQGLFFMDCNGSNCWTHDCARS